MSHLILGSRGSVLALAQVAIVKGALATFNPSLEIEVKIITTSGDRRQEVKAGEGSDAGLKGLFTKEIQDALLNGSIHAAVHSLKDLPGITPPSLGLAAVLPRADTSDLLISPDAAGPITLDALSPGARLGTGSVRRRRQIEWLRPGLEIVDLRGNVPTRVQRVKEGELRELPLHGTVLAAAGLNRLGLDLSGLSVRPFAPQELLPAPAQGALLVEARAGDQALIEALAGFHHPLTRRLVTLERSVLAGIGGGCQQPLGALAVVEPDGAILLRAAYALEGEIRVAEARGEDDGALVAQVLRGLGL